MRSLAVLVFELLVNQSMQDPAQKANPTSPPAAGARAYVLRFISGKYQGGEFPIVADKQVVVGRSSDLDMVLVEDMVSRKHARIALQQDQIWIEDLGSTNGTFVNGEKIKRQRLKEGDRVLIGTSILKVIAGEAEAQAENNNAPVAPKYTKSLSGSIEEIPLPDLLQLFGTSKKNGVLVVRTDTDSGKIFLRKGNIYYSTINDARDAAPLKAAYRMLSWEKGVFDLEAPDTQTFPGEVDASVQEVLMEGYRQLDELNAMRDKLPPMNARLMIPNPLPGKLRDLAPEELDVFQAALSEGNVQGVFDSAGSDLDAGSVLQRLLKSGYIEADIV
jgi:Domain of unknown function (DUF4388)/FHA domain